MAYFRCKKARKTGTDKSTRKSIAKGTTSPTFKHKSTGKETLRGVVQLDIISGRDMGYVTGKNVADRLASAGKGSTSSSKTMGKRKSVTSGSGYEPITVTSAQLRVGSPSTIKTSSILGMNKKTLIMAVIGIIVVGIVAVNK